MRGNVSEGLDGMWKSTDEGRTWRNIGLKEARHIVRLIVHPKNPDIIWAQIISGFLGCTMRRTICLASFSPIFLHVLPSSVDFHMPSNPSLTLPLIEFSPSPT